MNVRTSTSISSISELLPVVTLTATHSQTEILLIAVLMSDYSHQQSVLLQLNNAFIISSWKNAIMCIDVMILSLANAASQPAQAATVAPFIQLQARL